MQKRNKDIYFLPNFWFGFLLDLFGRSLQKLPHSELLSMLLCQILWKQKEWKKILYFAEKSIKSPILRMKNILYCHQKWSISPILSKIPFSYISDFGRYHPCLSTKKYFQKVWWKWIGFLKNFFLLKNQIVTISGVSCHTNSVWLKYWPTAIQTLWAN